MKVLHLDFELWMESKSHLGNHEKGIEQPQCPIFLVQYQLIKMMTIHRKTY